MKKFWVKFPEFRNKFLEELMKDIPWKLRQEFSEGFKKKFPEKLLKM